MARVDGFGWNMVSRSSDVVKAPLVFGDHLYLDERALVACSIPIWDIDFLWRRLFGSSIAFVVRWIGWLCDPLSKLGVGIGNGLFFTISVKKW